MALDIGRNGIVRRQQDGRTSILRPHRNGGPATEIEVAPELADEFRLVTGDDVSGETEPITSDEVEGLDSVDPAAPPDWEARFGEQPHVSQTDVAVVDHRQRLPAERLIRITGVNGLSLDEARDRPYPRSKRSQSERTPPDRRLVLADGPADAIGRTLDFIAPLGAGTFGVIHGPHGSGLTRTLQAILHGVAKHAPDCVPLVLLLRARAEEATEWRRRLPQAEVIVASATFSDAPPEQTLELCSLVLEAAQRQTEMGRDVVLAIDSLTGLWGAMLEEAQADAQQEADSSSARLRIREWVQKAGCFHGATPLGGGLGGSLTILGAVWHQAVDEEAEEERDTHPHLRLLEHILQDATWLVALSETLKRRALYPAIDVKRSRSQYEDRLLPAYIAERLLIVRGSLPRNNPVSCHMRLMDALESSRDLDGLVERLADAEAMLASDIVPREFWRT